MINAARIMARCDELARISELPDAIARIYLSPQQRAANELVQGWMREAGMATRVDAAGNIVGRYEVCTTGDAIDSQPLDGLRRGDIEALEALDAFSTAGTYKRSALARLYGGTRVRVARGWSASADRVESVTLLSPYPDQSLTHLDPGTMTIRLTVERSALEPRP